MTQAQGADTTRIRMRVEQIDGFEFRVRFDNDKYRELVLDEPPPLGHDAGPNAARLLGAAIADCLCASMLFCMNRAGVAVGPIDAEVVVEVARNDQRRLRIPRVNVTLRPTLEESDAISKCFAEFENFCLVTQSVRQGIDVRVTVEPTIDGVGGPTA